MVETDTIEPNPREVLGNNNPPATTVTERLSNEYEELAERVAGALTKARELPVAITTDDENDKLGEAIKAIRKLSGEIEESRTKENRPHLDGQRDTNAFFKSFTDRLLKGKDVLEKRGKAYLDAKAAEERRRREEAAKIAREEAEKREREARAAEEAGREVVADILLDQAVEAERRADLAEEAAQGSNAEMARTRTENTTATLKTEWTFTVENFEVVPLDQLRQFFTDAEITKAVRGYVKAGGRRLAGVKIFEETKAQYR